MGGNCFVVTADRSENRHRFPASKGKRIRSTPHWFSSLAEVRSSGCSHPCGSDLTGQPGHWLAELPGDSKGSKCGELLVWEPHLITGVHSIHWRDWDPRRSKTLIREWAYALEENRHTYMKNTLFYDGKMSPGLLGVSIPRLGIVF